MYYFWDRSFLFSTTFLEHPNEGCSWCCQGSCISS